MSGIKVQGVIDSITSKTVSNGGTVYTALIDGQEVNLGFKCDYSEGEYVDLDVESTKWGLQVPRFPAKKGGTPRPSTQAKPQASAPRATGKMFPVDPNSKDHSIIRQNALTNANTMVHNAVKYSDEGGFPTREEYYNEVIKAAYNLAGFAMGTLDKILAEQLATNKEANDEAAE